MEQTQGVNNIYSPIMPSAGNCPWCGRCPHCGQGGNYTSPCAPIYGGIGSWNTALVTNVAGTAPILDGTTPPIVS